MQVFPIAFDCEYTENPGVILFKYSRMPFAVCCGDRVALLVLERVATSPVVESLGLPRAWFKQEKVTTMSFLGYCIQSKPTAKPFVDVETNT